MEKLKKYNKNNVGEIVTLKGWVSKIRNLGGLIFIDLRNRNGITQAIVKPDSLYYELANQLKNEFVIEITGKVVERENKNTKFNLYFYFLSFLLFLLFFSFYDLDLT